MRLRKFASVAVVIFLTLTTLAAQQKNPLTNADVIKMVKAGLAETTIVAAIAANDTQFDLSSTGLQALNQAGRQQQGDPGHAGGGCQKEERSRSGAEFDACAGFLSRAGFGFRCIVRHGTPRHEPPGDAAGNAAGNVTGPDAADAANDEQHAS